MRSNDKQDWRKEAELSKKSGKPFQKSNEKRGKARKAGEVIEKQGKARKAVRSNSKKSPNSTKNK